MDLTNKKCTNENDVSKYVNQWYFHLNFLETRKIVYNCLTNMERLCFKAYKCTHFIKVVSRAVHLHLVDFFVSFIKCAPLCNWVQLLSYRISLYSMTLHIELVGWSLVRVSVRDIFVVAHTFILINEYECIGCMACVTLNEMNKLVPYKWKFRRNKCCLHEKQQKRKYA